MQISGDKTLTVVSKQPIIVEKDCVWIHTTASPKIGYGHLRRSLVIAKALENTSTPLFILDPEDHWSKSHLKKHCVNSFEDGFDKAWSELPQPSVIIIDTRFKGGLDAEIARAGSLGVPVVSIHDLGLNPLPSDVIIDGSIAPLHYGSSRSNAVRYEGTDYMILDPAYRALHRQKRKIRKEIRSISINLGGGNSGDFYLKVLEGIKLWGRETDVIGVSGFVSWGQEEVAERDWHPLHFRWETENIANLVAQADLAITAGGIASYEALCTGTPLLALSCDTFQQAAISALESSGACINLGPGNKLEPAVLSGMLSRMASDVDRRRLLSYRGKQTVDGLGADRVVRIIGSLIEERFKTGNRRGSDD